MTEGKTAAEFVGEWLDSSGAALELRTAQTFLKSTYFVEHAHHYTVKDAGTREIDVVARYSRDPNGEAGVEFRINVVVECKSLKQPWVLYPADRRLLTQDETLFNVSTTIQAAPRGHQIKKTGMHNAPLLRSQDHYYGIIDTNAGKDTTYAAVNQVWSAAGGIAGRMRSYDADKSVVTLVVPAVVTNVPLFSVRLREGGEPDIEPIDRALLITRMGSQRGGYRPVWVLTESAVAGFAEDVVTSLNALYFTVEPPPQA